MFEINFLNKKYHKKNSSSGTEIWDFLENPETEENRANRLESSYHRSRFIVFGIIIILAVGSLIFRTAYLQIYKHDFYQAFSEDNRVRTKVTKAPRGIFYDKNMLPLANNIPSFDLVLIPSLLPKEEKEKKSIAKNLAQIVQKPTYEEIMEIFDANRVPSLNPRPIAENIPRNQALLIETKKDELYGIQIEVGSRRQYLEGELISHILGYNGKINAEEIKEYPQYLLTDNVGKTGLEKTYETDLHGKPGAEKYEVDANGNVKKYLGKSEPISGNNLKLHLDLKVQRKLSEILKKNLAEKNLEKAAVIAINPKDGGVIAMISTPSYDNNLFSGGISQQEFQKISQDQNYPLLNRVIAGEFPPGSTFKLMVAAAALQEGIISRFTTITSTGGIQIDNWYFPDWKEGGHGPVDVVEAISQSVNTFFYYISGGFETFTGLGIDKIREYAEKFGLNKKLGIDLPGEKSGFLPDKNWKEEVKKEPWYIGDTYHAGIGQGDILLTPLQLGTYVCAISNGGTLYAPQIVDAVIDQDKNTIEDIYPRIINQNFISKENLDIIKEGMRRAVTQGSAKELADLPTPIAGKTGTAQAGSKSEPHSWFVSFAPYEDPEIVLVILIEHGGEGHETSIPVAKEFYEWYFSEENR
jgi:penicillin-binding protein 2